MAFSAKSRESAMALQPWQGVDKAQARRRGAQAAQDDVADGLLALTITGRCRSKDETSSSLKCWPEGYDEEMVQAIPVSQRLPICP